MQIGFEGKRVLITGGTQGIGLGIAIAFVEAGAEVAITGTRENAGEYEADLSGFSYHRVALDCPEQRAELAETVSDIDVLINNAGLALGDETDMQNHLKVIEVNLNAVADLSYRFLPSLRSASGAVVNIGSCASFLGIGSAPAYTASKAGLLGLTRALADAWARDNVRVNLVAPGFIETRMTAGVRGQERKMEGTLRAIPQRRFGSPAEVAAATLFLASPHASYITGQSLVVDGGLMIR
jgi:3-oxoacyl-[acyl-carrier protein] reductase